MPTDAGVLHLVPTPIGNLGDLSPRAIEVLRAADLLCCEDTRRTRRLLAHAGIAAPALAICNEHTEATVAPRVIDTLTAGGRVALVTDAGTPAMSDPGAHLVRAVLAAGFEVSALPGPFAGVTALVASGLPTDRFAFEGFLARKGSDRAAQLARIAASDQTVVLYEAPHRMERTLADLIAACGPTRPAAVARELTKMFEEIRRDALGEIDIGTPRGEYVIVIGPAPADQQAEMGNEQITAEVDECLAQGMSTRDAVDTVVTRHRLPHRRVYRLALDAATARRTPARPGTPDGANVDE